MVIPYLIGLDVGQVSDPSALVITQPRLVSWGIEQHLHYQARHLERFPLGTPYPTIVQRVKDRLLALPLPQGRVLATAARLQDDLPMDTAVVSAPQFHFLIDATGCGRPVADMFRVLAVWPVMVTMTHGFQTVEHDREEYSVPKPTLIGALQVVLQEQRFRVAASLPEAQTLVKEALNFQYRLSVRTGDDTYGAWREGEHDDLLFAAALTAWYGERRYAPTLGHPAPQRYATATGNPLRRRTKHV
jgi:hypothetical protein